MEHRACLRCGSLDLVMPGAFDGVSYEGGQLLNSTCRSCGLTSPPMLFPDRDSWARFHAERSALYRAASSGGPAAAPVEEAPERSELRPAQELPTGPGPRTPLMRGLAVAVGGLFVLGAVASLVTAAGTGGSAWAVLLPGAVLSLLLGLPILAMARRGR